MERSKQTADKGLPPPAKEIGSSSADLVCLSSAQPEVATWYHTARYRVAAPGVSSARVKFCMCQQMYTRWAKCCSQIPNICAPHTRGCQLSLLCPLLCHNWVSKAAFQIAQCHSKTFEIHQGMSQSPRWLITETTIEEYIEHSHMDQNRVWGTQN